jgi:hypothetical protein
MQMYAQQQSSSHFWNTLETTASTEKIWHIWTDVNNWHTWDTGLKKAEIQGSFTMGITGTITSLEGRKSNFKVVEFIFRQSYTFKTKLPLGSLYVKRYMDIKDGKVYFTHEVWFSGLTGRVFARKFGSRFREMLPEVMNNIKKLAETHD